MQGFNSQPLLEISRTRINGFCGFSVAWSPFYPDQLAVATSANFGLVGNGKLETLQRSNPKQLQPQTEYLTQDGLYGVVWSEAHERQLATCSGDGSVKLWDLTVRDGLPIARWKEHQGEVHNLDWSNLQKDTFLTASADQTMKLWNPSRPSSLQTIPTQHGCVYAAHFSPHQPQLVASAHFDGFVLLTDLRTPQGRPALSFKAHDTEALSLDWNKYQPLSLATGSVDRSIRIHDLRAPMSNQSQTALGAASKGPHGGTTTGQSSLLLGHQFAVRKVAWSPHSSHTLASASYDLTARLWSVDGGGLGKEIGRHDGHSEFVVGLSWSLFEPGLLATCSWDQQVHLCKANL